jgi:uncharacterized protein YndB with AHSA1/START domain
VIHNTFVLERAWPAAPERLYAAFANPAKKRGWFVEGEGHEVEHSKWTSGREAASASAFVLRRSASKRNPEQRR